MTKTGMGMGKAMARSPCRSRGRRHGRSGSLWCARPTRPGCPVDDLPHVIGVLVEVEEHARLRLRSTPATNGERSPGREPEVERQLTPQEAADVIGGVSARWVLRHTKGLRFRHDLCNTTYALW